jgi:hypothetical protein
MRRSLSAALLCLAAACGEGSGAEPAKSAAADSTQRGVSSMAATQTAQPPGVVANEDAAITSVYTSLGEQACRVVDRDDETGGTVSRCPGVAGHVLLVSDDDARMSVDVLKPDGEAHPLNYWGVITSSFSSLGPRAEWRMRGDRPIALIVRVNAAEDPENPQRYTSYLAVAKITAGDTCVTDRIRPAADANATARVAADRSAERPCLGLVDG